MSKQVRWLYFTKAGIDFKIRAIIIAKHKANYYGAVKESTAVFKEEFDLAMQDVQALIAWAEDNMKWKELKAEVVLPEEVSSDPFFHCDVDWKVDYE